MGVRQRRHTSWQSMPARRTPAVCWQLPVHLCWCSDRALTLPCTSGLPELCIHVLVLSLRDAGFCVSTLRLRPQGYWVCTNQDRVCCWHCTWRVAEKAAVQKLSACGLIVEGHAQQGYVSANFDVYNSLESLMRMLSQSSRARTARSCFTSSQIILRTFCAILMP